MQDKYFDKKKQNVVWPLFSFKQTEDQVAPQSDMADCPQENRTVRQKKIGFDHDKFKAIPSVRQVNELQTLQSLSNSKHPKKVSESDTEESDSEDEWKRADFFETAVFW